MERAFAALAEFVAFASVSSSPDAQPEIARCVEWLEARSAARRGSSR